MINKNYCILILILIVIYLFYRIKITNNEIKEKMTSINNNIAKIDDTILIPNSVEITRLAIIKEPIQIKYKTNTNHMTNTKNSLVQKITHPSRFKFKFNNNKYNLYELRIIKSERLVTLGQPFDLEIHLIHKNANNIFDTLVLVFPIRITNKECDDGLFKKLFGSIADIPEKNNFQVYNGKIQTIDYNCFSNYLLDTEICYYNPSSTYLIIQKPILENKKFIKTIQNVLE
jgi:hypothetical protein